MSTAEPARNGSVRLTYFGYVSLSRDNPRIQNAIRIEHNWA